MNTSHDPRITLVNVPGKNDKFYYKFTKTLPTGEKVSGYAENLSDACSALSHAEAEALAFRSTTTKDA